MTMQSIEDLVREAQARQAQRAADPDHIWAALPKRVARRARRRNGAVICGGVALLVAGALIVPVVLTGQRSAGTAGLAPAAPPSASPAAVAGPASPVIPYKLTWVPSGFAERDRMYSVQDGTASFMRSWTSKAADAQGETKNPAIDLTVRAPSVPDDPAVNGGTPVDVNGKTAYYHAPDGGDDKSYVEYLIDPKHIVMISQTEAGVSRDQLLQMARSVQPDSVTIPTAVTLTSVRLSDVESIRLSGNGAATWLWWLTMRDTTTTVFSPGPDGRGGKQTQNGAELDITVGTGSYAPAGGEPLTVNGRAARYVSRTVDHGPEQHFLVVQLDPARQLTIQKDNLQKEALVKLAEGIDPAAGPDVTWMGH
jgi:hypothetical protein